MGPVRQGISTAWARAPSRFSREVLGHFLTGASYTTFSRITFCSLPWERLAQDLRFACAKSIR